MIRVLFVNRRFERGGAERQLIALVRGLAERHVDVTIATFYPGGGLLPEIEAVPGVRLVCLGKKGRWDALPALRRLRQVALQTQPHIVHGYMGVANTASLLVGRLVGARVVWGVRASNMNLRHYDWLSRAVVGSETVLARFPDLVIVNSRAGRDYWAAHGYPRDKLRVIPNGIDTDRFRPDSDARMRLRAELGIAPDERLVGLIARLDPMKDHLTFLRAAALLAQERSDIRFFCAGQGSKGELRRLQAISERLGLGQRVIWGGTRADMPSVYSALDLATSSSAFGEGFSNAIAEAMACGIPCVVTDVGDSAWIVGDTGEVVRPQDPLALVAGWRAMLNRLDAAPGAPCEAARARVVTQFGLDRFVDSTYAALARLV